MMESLEIVDLFRGIVADASKGLVIECPDGEGGFVEVKEPSLNYIFGNAQYVKDMLDAYGKASETTGYKFPLVALFCPIRETRNDPGYYSKAKVNLIIACSSRKDWTNDTRNVTSFKRILRPIYRNLIKVLKESMLFDWGYDELVKHDYSENYSYGRYGAYTESKEEVSEPIDAIDLRSLEIKINNPICKRK